MKKNNHCLYFDAKCSILLSVGISVRILYILIFFCFNKKWNRTSYALCKLDFLYSIKYKYISMWPHSVPSSYIYI